MTTEIRPEGTDAAAARAPVRRVGPDRSRPDQAGLPDPRPGDPRPPARLPRLRGDVAEAVGRDRGRSTPTTATTTRTSTAASTRWPSVRPPPTRARGSRSRGCIGAQDPHEIIWTRNATESINLVAYAWGRKHIARGDVIVLTEMEHHANLVPWQILAQEKDADLEFIPITDDGILRQDVFDVLLRLKPKLVAFTHVVEHAGHDQPGRGDDPQGPRGRRAGPHRRRPGRAAPPGRRGRDRLRLLRVQRPQDARARRAPACCGAARELLEAMPPFMGGGDMIREVHLRRSEWNDIPWKFEAGTPDIAAQIGLGVAADYLLDLGMDNGPRARARARRLRARGAPARGARASSCTARRPDQRGGVVPFNLPGRPPARRGPGPGPRSASRSAPGHHCTMPLHERLDLGATARASFQVYTTKCGHRRAGRRPQGGPAAVRRLTPACRSSLPRSSLPPAARRSLRPASHPRAGGDHPLAERTERALARAPAP